MSHVSRYLIFILAAIITIGPLSIDLYLPAMPSMVDYYGVDIGAVQATLSSYLLGFAVFHLVCGPLSDRFGRRPVLLAGLSLYVFMSVLCVYAQTIDELILYRFFQAMGACCAPTLGRAIVRDVYPPEESVKALAYVSSLMALAPVVAPTLGGILLQIGDWRLSFWALVIAGLIAILLTLFLVPESLPEKQKIHPLHILSNFRTLLTDKFYVGNVLTAAFIYAGVFAFLSGASFVLIDFLGVSEQFFGAYFLAIVSGYITGNLFTARIAHAWPAALLYERGLLIFLTGSSTLVLICVMRWYYPILMVLPMFLVTLSIGLVLPHSMGLALKPFPHMAATASAMMGFLQMGMASLAGWAVGQLLVDEPGPMAWVIFSSGIMACLMYVLLLRKSLTSN